MPGDDFPPLPAPAEGSPTLALDVDVLQELIAKTHFSISTDETRAHLNSRAVRVGRRHRPHGHDRRAPPLEDGGEGHRAAGVGDDAHPAQGDPGAAPAVRRDARGAAKDAAKDGAPKPQLQITQSGSSAFFQGGGMTFSVRLVDAQFPPYAQVIPQNSEREGRAGPARRVRRGAARRVGRGERAHGRREARAREGHDAHHERVARERRRASTRSPSSTRGRT